MKIAIIYHNADFDGLLSREVCHYWLARRHPEAEIEDIGWDYGQPLPTREWWNYDEIYIVDLSIPELMGSPKIHSKITWIDHHKSAIDTWDNDSCRVTLKGYRIDGVAACRLCWQWFAEGNKGFGALPAKDEYVERTVCEPDIIRLAGEYDVWDHRDPNAIPLQYGLKTIPDFRQFVWNQFETFFANHGPSFMLQHVILAGQQIDQFLQAVNQEYAAAVGHTLNWEGLKFCCLNTAQRGSSLLFRGALKPEHDACFGWRYDGTQVSVSLYHAPGHEAHDLSEIAKKYGGGGHRGACGFRLPLAKLAELFETK